MKLIGLGLNEGLCEDPVEKEHLRKRTMHCGNEERKWKLKSFIA